MPALTSIAAGVSIAATATGAGMSFAQASKQKKKAAEAEAAAAEAMRNARQKLEINFYKGLGINREPYELERDALLSAGTSLIQAGTESERGANAIAGRVLAGQNTGQRQIATDMGREIQDLNKLVAAEDANLNRLGLNLDLATVEGANKAAANYEAMRNKSIEQGFAGVTNTASQLLANAPLYQKNSAAKQLSNLEQNYNDAIAGNNLGSQYKTNGQPMTFQEALMLKTGNQGMDATLFNNYMLGQNKGFYNNLLKSGFGNPNANIAFNVNDYPLTNSDLYPTY